MKKIHIMGILNVTPDSFSDGGLYFQDTEKAVDRGVEMLQEGADIIDIGGQSTRPGSEAISVEEEIIRIVPVIEALRQRVGKTVLLSIDTNKAEVADAALRSGTDMVNSLGGFSFDPELAAVIKNYACSCVIYHIKGNPKTMQQDITYTDVVREISEFFEEQISLGIGYGIKREQFILDPGIGFGKTLEHNLEIVRRFHEFKTLELPLLIGVSRKSHLGSLLKEKMKLSEVPPAGQRLEAALAETAIAIQHGATYVRTHDVNTTKRFTTVLEEIL